MVSGIAVQPLATSGISHVVGFAPSQLTGLVGWYDATQVTGISSGASLSAWTDLSGNAHHLLQSSVASQPNFFTNAHNGLSAVSSLGSFSFMTSGFTLAQPCTVAFATSIATIGNQNNCIDGVAAASLIIGRITADTWQMFGGAAVLDSLTSISVGTWYTVGGIFSGSSSTMFVGSATSFGNAGTTAPNGLSVFGRASPSTAFAGRNQIGELTLYNRALAATELSRLTAYLISKWSTL